MRPKAGVKAAAVDEDDDKPKKVRSSRSKRRHTRRSHSSSSSSSGSESPGRKRSKKPPKRPADKRSRRSKASTSGGGSSSRRRRRSRSFSPSPSLSSSSSSPSPSRIHSRRSCSTCSSSSASERSVSPPPRSRSRDARRKGWGRDRDRGRDRKRKRGRRLESYSSSTASSGSSCSRSRSKGKSRKRRDDGARDKAQLEHDNRRASRSVGNMIQDVERDEEEDANTKEGEDVHYYKKNEELDKMESPPSKDANETEEIIPAGSRSPTAEDLELILRQKALENFRKFRQAAVMSGKTHNNGAGKESLTDCPQNAGTKTAEARFAIVTPLQKQGSSLGVRHSAGSHTPEDCGNGASHSLKQESSAGMRRGAGSPRRILEVGGTGNLTQQKGVVEEETHSTSQLRSSQDDRNSHSVMQRLVRIPGSSASVNQRLGSSAGVSHVNGTPRVRSVVSIPAREEIDASTYTTSTRPCEISAPVESNSKVGCPLVDINKADGTSEDDRKTIEASASSGSFLSPAEGRSQARIGDREGSQFQKKTFSRMHDGEAVEVSYKVYIPKKTPALARRKLQR
ncbi:hypothetical protein ACP4OV_012022 [Aristida adscensionis]